MRPPSEREQVVLISEESPLQRRRLVHDLLRFVVTEPGFLSIMHSVIGGQERGVDAGRYVVTPEKLMSLRKIIQLTHTIMTTLSNMHPFDSKISFSGVLPSAARSPSSLTWRRTDY